MVAFGGLAFVPALLSRHHTSGCSRLASLARRLSAGTGPCFVVVLTAGLVQYETPMAVPAWSFGLAERLLVALEFALAGVLTTWAWRGCRCGLDGLIVSGRAWSGSPHHGPRAAGDRGAAAPVGRLPVPATGDADTDSDTRLIA
jgi:hypothetical protein